MEDIFVMKCFARRAKDRSHCVEMIGKGIDLKLVENRLQELYNKNIDGSQKALDFFDDLTGG